MLSAYIIDVAFIGCFLPGQAFSLKAIVPKFAIVSINNLGYLRTVFEVEYGSSVSVKRDLIYHRIPQAV